MPMVNAADLRIVTYPDPILRKKAKPISEITDEVRAVAQRMLELMREACGVGLAAPQVGLSWQMFVANSGEEDEPDRIYINPTLTEPEGAVEPHEEGCLSIPEVVGDILRPPAITITATDLEGQSFTLRSDELLARVWQHEVDHLKGMLILDRFSQMDKLKNRKIIKELEREAED